MSATYHHELWDPNYTGFIHADYIYTGKQYSDETNLAYLGASNRLNLQVGLQRGPYEVALVATNVTNDKTPVAISDVSDQYVSGRYDLLLSPAAKPYYGIRLHISM